MIFVLFLLVCVLVVFMIFKVKQDNKFSLITISAAIAIAISLITMYWLLLFS